MGWGGRTRVMVMPSAGPRRFGSAPLQSLDSDTFQPSDPQPPAVCPRYPRHGALAATWVVDRGAKSSQGMFAMRRQPATLTWPSS
jgi:hypothetical protein